MPGPNLMQKESIWTNHCKEGLSSLLHYLWTLSGATELQSEQNQWHIWPEWTERCRINPTEPQVSLWQECQPWGLTNTAVYYFWPNSNWEKTQIVYNSMVLKRAVVVSKEAWQGLHSWSPKQHKCLHFYSQRHDEPLWDQGLQSSPSIPRRRPPP